MSQDARSQTNQMVLESLSPDEHAPERLSARSDTLNSEITLKPTPQKPSSADSSDDSEEKASTNPVHIEAIDNPQAFVEATANELMHDVFDDVDRMLDKGAIIPPNHLTHAETNTREFAAIPQNSGGALAPLSRIEENPLELEPLIESSGEHPEDGTPTAAKSPKLGTVLVRMAFVVAASVGLGVGLAWWMAQRQQAEFAQSTAVNSTDAFATTAGAETDSFLNYILESLEAIDRRYELLARAGDPVGDSTADEGGDDLASIADDRDDQNNDGTVNGVERVYIPVYQPPQGTGTWPPLASAPLNPATTVPTAPTVHENSTPAPVQNISPSNTHTLVGALELGDRSAAIFEYAGSAHRIEIGEQIGSSGWSLVSVSGNEATIRRNGDVRTIFMQQSF